MNLSSVITQLAVLFIIIGVGYTAAKLRALPEHTNTTLAQVVIHVTNPCMVLYSVLGTERVLTNGEVYLLTGIAVGLFAVLIATGIVLAKLLRVEKAERNAYRFLGTFGNFGFLGFPVISALYGPNAVFYASIFNLVMQLVAYSYGDALMDPASKGVRLSPKTLLSPMIVSSVLAYVFYLTNFRAPEVVVKTLGSLSAVTSPMAMLIIGIALAKVPLAGIFTNWRLYVMNAVRLVLLPLAVYGLLSLFVENRLILGITVVMCGMPAATISTLFAAKYGQHEKLTATAVFLSTGMSIVTIPLLMWLLFT